MSKPEASDYWTYPEQRQRIDKEHSHARRIIADREGPAALEEALKRLGEAIDAKHRTGPPPADAPWMHRD